MIIDLINTIPILTLTDLKQLRKPMDFLVFLLKLISYSCDRSLFEERLQLAADINLRDDRSRFYYESRMDCRSSTCIERYFCVSKGSREQFLPI